MASSMLWIQLMDEDLHQLDLHNSNIVGKHLSQGQIFALLKSDSNFGYDICS